MERNTIILILTPRNFEWLKIEPINLKILSVGYQDCDFKPNFPIYWEVIN